MSEHPSVSSVESPSGAYIDVKCPDPATLDLRDIAHMLALTNRFNGATGHPYAQQNPYEVVDESRYGPRCPVPYSVAEHAVAVSRRIEQMGHPLVEQLAGLHHDDPEHVLNDIVRPMKPLIGEKYKRLTERLERAIVVALDLPFGPELFHSKAVLAADRFNLMVEARDLLPSQGRGWEVNAGEWDLEDMPSRIIRPDYYRGGLDPDTAKRAFIDRHWELMEALK